MCIWFLSEVLLCERVLLLLRVTDEGVMEKKARAGSEGDMRLFAVIAKATR